MVAVLAARLSAYKDKERQPESRELKPRVNEREYELRFVSSLLWWGFWTFALALETWCWTGKANQVRRRTFFSPWRRENDNII